MDMIGKTLGRFSITTRLGAGGMGEVWKARDERLGREVAVKVISERLGDDPAALARFEREAKAVAALNHPNILSIFDYGREGDLTYAVMELLEGETLHQRISQGPLPASKAIDIAGQIAKGLTAAHEKGITHRDLKPANIFLSRGGQVKILDFGLVRVSEPVPAGSDSPSQGTTAEAHTHPGTMLGTIGYMSPEQARGLPADARSDLFAFGAVLYEMLAGKKAFGGATASDALVAILTKDPPPLPRVTPPGLDRIVRQCLEKRPEDRFSSVHDLALALQAVSTAGEPAPISPRTTAWVRRHWAAATAGAAAIVLLTVLLAADIGGLRSRVFGPRSPAASIRSIAVLPLANLSGNPEQEYFADGMTEELITNLSKISALKVISRISAMQFKGSHKSLREIAAALGVDAVIEGSVLRAGDRVRITAQLIDADTDAHLWAESYERDLRDVLALQGEVARTVAAEIKATITPQERDRLAVARAVNPEAYDAYLKGLHHWYKLVPVELDTAQRYFELALEKDPDYALAYAGIAMVWVGRQQMRFASPGEAAPKAKAAGLKAVALDDSVAEAHYALASVMTWSEWDWAGAEPEFKRAIELSPSYPDARAYYSQYLMIMRRPAEAMPQMERALELDPFNALFQSLYAVDLLFVRRTDDALAAARKALDMQPDAPVAAGALYWTWYLKGMHSDMLASDKARAAGDPELAQALDRGEAEGGFEGAQRRAADVLAQRFGKPGAVPAMTVAAVYFLSGENERVMAWLERACDAREPHVPYLGMPQWDPFRSDPRFVALLRRIGLPAEAAR